MYNSMKTTTTMAEIDTSEIREAIADILEDADLSALSAKKIRRQLEDKFDADLTERKVEIDKLIMKMIAEKADSQNSEEDGSESEESESEPEEEIKAPPKKKAKATTKKPAPKTANRSSSKTKSKKTVDSSDEDLSDEEKNGDDLDDEQLARKLQAEESRTRHRSAKKTPSKKKDANDKPRKPRTPGQSIYSRPCNLTPELAGVLGTDKMARKDIVKNMWSIVKERNLQDPANKQFMLCDDQLLKVFGKKRVRTFGMMKYLKNHIL